MAGIQSPRNAETGRVRLFDRKDIRPAVEKALRIHVKNDLVDQLEIDLFHNRTDEGFQTNRLDERNTRADLDVFCHERFLGQYLWYLLLLFLLLLLWLVISKERVALYHALRGRRLRAPVVV